MTMLTGLLEAWSAGAETAERDRQTDVDLQAGDASRRDNEDEGGEARWLASDGRHASPRATTRALTT